jgi:hypothetical protein
MTQEQNARSAQAVQMLTAQLDAAKVLSSGPPYDEARQIWNAAVTRRPAVIVLCENTSDVQSSVRAAVTCGLSLSVRGGGHDWAGRALKGDLVVDLTRMRRVSIEGQVATVSGGATAMEVAEAAQPYGLAAVTGTMGCVSIAGLTPGGGYCPLTGRFGMGGRKRVRTISERHKRVRGTNGSERFSRLAQSHRNYFDGAESGSKQAQEDHDPRGSELLCAVERC